jgi:hypothetical protein
MKRSVTWLGGTLGSAALLALGIGCHRESQPQTPPAAGTTSPTFESNVPPGTPPAGQAQPAPAPEMGALPPTGPGQPPGEAAPPPAPPPAAPAPPPEMGAQPGAAPRGAEQPSITTGGGESERQLCDKLVTVAKIHVEDVQKGVAIVIVPKPGQDLSMVRDDARRVESMIHQHASPETAPPPAEACGLFIVARLPSVTSTLTEGAKSVRILMTTTNPAELKDLRRSARDQVHNLYKGGR